MLNSLGFVSFRIPDEMNGYEAYQMAYNWRLLILLALDLLKHLYKTAQLTNCHLYL